MAGDFNVAPDHNMDTLGYLHVNNPNSRFFIDKMKSLNMMTDVFGTNTLTLANLHLVKNKHTITLKQG